jgi:hypothetical protein
MRRYWRWLAVLAGIALLALLPAAVAALPVSAPGVGVAQLQQQIAQSSSHAYSGYAESDGGLALPVTGGQFTSLTDLLGGQSQLRVWWRTGTDWRVDQLNLAGETDVHADADGTWTWNYESNRATITNPPVRAQVRLPVAADLLPPELGRRLLSQATVAELSPLAPQRIAGRDAVGLRLRPSDQASTIDHVDVWADVATSIPLRVAVYAKGSASPGISSSFLDFSADSPAASTTAFTVPAGARVQSSDGDDLASIINRFGGGVPPPALLGVSRNALLGQVGAIGVYGRGVTEFIAAPLPGRLAGSLHDQLQKAPGVSTTPAGLSISVGPLSLLLTNRAGQGRYWLLIGTVTDARLAAAAAELADYRGPTG